jgi:hypothetical protein
MPRDPVFLKGADLLHMGPKSAVVMTVDKILPASALTLASSKAKSGKTTLAVALSYAVVTSTDFLDTLRLKQAPVFYWAAGCRMTPTLNASSGPGVSTRVVERLSKTSSCE